MWFGGDVSEAINKIKKEQKILMVFIEGEDEESKKMASVFENLKEETLNAIINALVCIKIANGSPNFVHFAQLFRVFMIPSTFFIDGKGKPLEIIAGAVTEEEFKTKVSKALILNRSFQQSSLPQVNSNVLPSGATCPSTSKLNPDEPNKIEKESETQLDKAGQLEKVQKLIEERRKLREKEEEEKARRLEKEKNLERKELMRAQANRKDLEMAEIVKEREKEKTEERRARERVLAQIAADKEERRKRAEFFNQTLSKCSKTDTPSTSSASTADSRLVKIQFRFPNGSSKAQQFTADDPLCALRQYVIDTSYYRDFELSTVYPKHIFTNDQMTTNLKDLGLTPSAVIMVISKTLSPSTGNSIIPTSFFTQIWFLLTAPFLTIWTFFTSYGSTTVNSTNSSNEKESKPGTSYQEEREAKRQRESKYFNREGNIARLRDNRSSDNDEDNTWNGNSTQQM